MLLYKPSSCPRLRQTDSTHLGQINCTQQVGRMHCFRAGGGKGSVTSHWQMVNAAFICDPAHRSVCWHSSKIEKAAQQSVHGCKLPPGVMQRPHRQLEPAAALEQGPRARCGRHQCRLRQVRRRRPGPHSALLRAPPPSRRRQARRLAARRCPCKGRDKHARQDTRHFIVHVHTSQQTRRTRCLQIGSVE